MLTPANRDGDGWRSGYQFITGSMTRSRPRSAACRPISAAVVPDSAARSTSGGLSVARRHPVAAVAAKRSARGELKPTVPAHRMNPVGPVRPAGSAGLVFRDHLTDGSARPVA